MKPFATGLKLLCIIMILLNLYTAISGLIAGRMPIVGAVSAFIAGFMFCCLLCLDILDED